jgi:hypothetical protein
MRKPMAKIAGRCYGFSVSEQNEIPPKQNYKWPWFVLAAVLLFFALAVLWMSFAVKRERQERNFNAPLPSSAPTR